MTDITITLKDFRACGVCTHSKHWFAQHGLDWRTFVSQGLPLSTFRATGDQETLIDRLELAARKRLATPKRQVTGYKHTKESHAKLLKSIRASKGLAG